MLRRVLVVLLIAAAASAGLVAWLNLRGEAPLADIVLDTSPAAVARGRAAAIAGNCAGCHTSPGGAPYAGGPGIATPFGTAYAGNLTSDATHGLGRWTPAEFRRAMRHGRSRDGRLLVPVFPYPNTTQVSDADNDALFAYLKTVAPAAQPNRPHELRFPYGTQAALAMWRAFFFRPGAFEPDATQTAAWNRGAYLVRGLGHCNACHADRNLLGATGGIADLGGGPIPQQQWYAPALDAAHEAGVAAWTTDEIVALLGTGMSPRGSVLGPMAEVVFQSTQHLPREDLAAIATYLRSLPPRTRHDGPHPPAPTDPRVAQRYADLCADCHGPQGQGAAGAVAPLAGNRTVLLESPANVVKVILAGGFPPATAGNPRPHGMPPFGPQLDDAEVAALATFIRNRWGNAAPPVTPLEVLRLR
jgi:mono/diheme cytochrome c family protein